MLEDRNEQSSLAIERTRARIVAVQSGAQKE